MEYLRAQSINIPLYHTRVYNSHVSSYPMLQVSCTMQGMYNYSTSMYLCVCMYVCMYVIHMYVCMHVCMCMYVCCM